MTRNSPPSIGLALGVLALVACGDTTTEPETTGSFPSTTPSLAVASNSWMTRADMPRTRYGPAAAAVNKNSTGQSILYVMGGETPGGGISNTVQAYNVATNTWTTKARLPTPGSAGLYRTNGAGVINGKVYIAGGLPYRRSATGALYVYDPATNTWSQKSFMPGQGFSGVTGVINSRLYVLTGCSRDFGADCEGEPLAFYRYDPATDQWATLPTPTKGHSSGVGGVIGGKFYVAGGADESQLDVYDPGTNQWTTKAPMPSPRWLGGGAALGGKLYVIGGLRKNLDGTVTVVRTTTVYDPGTNTWTTRAPMPTARARIAASRVLLNGQARIEVVGGDPPGNNLQYIP